MNLKYCVGRCKCYKDEKCIFNDDIEKLSEDIETADGIIIGSPTHASNVSGQMKVIIDRGYFMIEQLLFGKYAISVSTYENYGGKDTAKILNKLLCYSGATISISLVIKTPFSCNQLSNHNITKAVKYRRFYLHKFLSATLSSFAVALATAQSSALQNKNLFCVKFIDI